MKIYLLTMNGAGKIGYKIIGNADVVIEHQLGDIGFRDITT